jgi:ComF family protein
MCVKGVICAALYEAGPTKQIIHCLKYSGITELSDILGELICQKLARLMTDLSKELVIVPVPLHKARMAERGFNQSELIGKFVSYRLNIPGGDALSRTRSTKPQADLKRRERLTNLTGCFFVADRGFIVGKSVLLIDDVATTGTTINECAKVLLSAGAKEVWGVVAAHG